MCVRGEPGAQEGCGGAHASGPTRLPRSECQCSRPSRHRAALFQAAVVPEGSVFPTSSTSDSEKRSQMATDSAGFKNKLRILDAKGRGTAVTSAPASGGSCAAVCAPQAGGREPGWPAAGRGRGGFGVHRLEWRVSRALAQLKSSQQGGDAVTGPAPAPAPPWAHGFACVQLAGG